MTTLLVTHTACIDHDPGSYHPESPARLKAVLAALAEPAFKGLERMTAPRAEESQLARCHPQGYVEAVLASIPASGRQAFDGDTVVSPGSGEAALRAAGAVVAAVDAVCAGRAKNAFCAVRPPGHHAEAMHAMGFCLFNNVAVGALHARAVHDIERVAAIDFDVHHGNGTQHMFERDPSLFYASTHQWPFYPGTGAAEERGVGNIVNAPLHSHAGGPEFRAAFGRRILPALDKFKPGLV
ncbi:MAG: histone deacetylase family protein, partial [Rhodospirillales bacterium]|nr:histone deacetylase family protein [Rhodospirillales bacterium]